MKKMLYLLFLAFAFSCQEKSKPSEAPEGQILSMTFKDYREIQEFEKYEKVSDTVIYTGSTGNKFRLLHLKHTCLNPDYEDNGKLVSLKHLNLQFRVK